MLIVFILMERSLIKKLFKNVAKYTFSQASKLQATITISWQAPGQILGPGVNISPRCYNISKLAARGICTEKIVKKKMYRKNVRKVLKHVAQLKLQHITYTAAK